MSIVKFSDGQWGIKFESLDSNPDSFEMANTYEASLKSLIDTWKAAAANKDYLEEPSGTTLDLLKAMLPDFFNLQTMFENMEPEGTKQRLQVSKKYKDAFLDEGYTDAVYKFQMQKFRGELMDDAEKE